MKRRFFTLLLAIIMFTSAFYVEGFATTVDSAPQIEYLADGGYIITTTQETETRATNSKTGTRVKSRYTSNDVLEWQIILRGVFTYTGTTSTCTASSIAVNIYDSNYVKKSSSSSKSGNTAKGSATISKKVLGVTVSTNTYNLTLSCDKDGNLS